MTSGGMQKKQHTCIIRISEISVLLRNYDKGCERWTQVDLQCGPHYVGCLTIPHGESGLPCRK